MICFTRRGAETGLRICEALRGNTVSLWIKKANLTDAVDERIHRCSQSLSEWTKEQFGCQDLLVFIGAAGIAVRAIAPFVKSKKEDPAVLCVDEQGKYVIALLSGHIGGANEYAMQIAEETGALPVITTATDLNHKFAVDVFARDNHLWISDMSAAKQISAALLDKEPVILESDYPLAGEVPLELILEKGRRKTVVQSDILQAAQSDTLSMVQRHNETGTRKDDGGKAANQQKRSAVMRIHISDHIDVRPDTLTLMPRDLILGAGCRRGKDPEEFVRFIMQNLEEEHIDIHRIESMHSIDLKAGEPALVQFGEKYKIPFITHSAGQLQAVEGDFSTSEFVARTVGVDNVCERSALCGQENAELILRKRAENGMTMAVAKINRRISF